MPTTTKLDDDIVSKIDKVVYKCNGRYNNRTHFVKIAIMRLLKEENE